ncbi:MAG: tRNA lysidine(34) synthetase TilS, partial [Acidobacteriota bacterium]|nr:tRNA lysidine(34) synthetase TilS [Acidobacteriota bacterium]
NRIRHALLPALTREWNPLLPETLANMAKWALAEEAYWTEEIDRLASQEITRRGPAVLMDASRVRRLPLAVQRRLIRRAIELSKGDLRSVDFCHVERIVELVSGPNGRARLQVPGTDVLRSCDWVSMTPCVPIQQPATDFEFPVPIPGTIQLPERGSTIDLRMHEGEAIYTEDVNCLDADRFSGSLVLRNWRPGDHYVRAGHAGKEKIKHLFQKARIPVWERGSWPVITQAGEIVWARTFGAGAEFAVTPETRRALLIQETGVDGRAGESWNRDPVD